MRFYSAFRMAVISGFALTSSLAFAETKANFDPSKAQEGGLGMPSPYDKFMALDDVLKSAPVDWQSIFNAVAVDMDTDAINDPNVSLPVMTGIRIADGVMAIQSRDAELLNKCATDIERLAGKMGVPSQQLDRAKQVRSYASEGNWLRVFLELGYLQQDILRTLENTVDGARADLLIMSGWMQGMRYAATVVAANHSDDTSGLLREPILVVALQAKAEAFPDDIRSADPIPQLLKILPALHSIVDVPLNSPIARSEVDRIVALTTEFVVAASDGAR